MKLFDQQQLVSIGEPGLPGSSFVIAASDQELPPE
jgi:hypothetical protein